MYSGSPPGLALETAAATWGAWARQWWRSHSQVTPSVALAQELAGLGDQCATVLQMAAIAPGDIVTVLGTSGGLLTCGAADAAGAQGRVITLDYSRTPLAIAAAATRAVGLVLHH